MLHLLLRCPSNKSLQYWVLLNEMTDTRTGNVPVSGALGHPPPSSQLVLDRFLSPELICNVPAWCEVVGVDRAITEHGIETLEDFRSHCDERSELNGVEVDVCKEVVFDLGHNL